MGVGVNEIVFPFSPTTNVLTMGAITQGHVACSTVKETI
jgi:hypothetical protein